MSHSSCVCVSASTSSRLFLDDPGWTLGWIIKTATSGRRRRELPRGYDRHPSLHADGDVPRNDERALHDPRAPSWIRKNHHARFANEQPSHGFIVEIPKKRDLLNAIATIRIEGE